MTHAEQKKMKRIYFDGSFGSAADVLTACVSGRVWLVFSRDAPATSRTFLEQACQTDACGSRGHFEGGRFVRHESTGSPRFCEPRSSTAEDLIALVAANVFIPEEEKVGVLCGLRPCPRASCGTCTLCLETAATAERYGIYDLAEEMRERAGAPAPSR